GRQPGPPRNASADAASPRWGSPTAALARAPAPRSDLPSPWPPPDRGSRAHGRRERTRGGGAGHGGARPGCWRPGPPSAHRGVGARDDWRAPWPAPRAGPVHRRATPACGPLLPASLRDPASALISEVLPAPLGPRTATTSPAATLNSTSRSKAPTVAWIWASSVTASPASGRAAR